MCVRVACVVQQPALDPRRRMETSVLIIINSRQVGLRLPGPAGNKTSPWLIISGIVSPSGRPVLDQMIRRTCSRVALSVPREVSDRQGGNLTTSESPN